MLQMEELLNTKFEKAIFGGYAVAQVDSFVEMLISEYNKLKDENEELKGKLKVVLDKVVEYQKDEAALHDALLSAQRTANSITGEAQEKAAEIVGEAEKKRDEVMEAAKRITEEKRKEYLRDLSTDIAKLENCRKATEEFVKKIVRSYQVQIERLQTISGMELDRTAAYVEGAEQNDIVGEYVKNSAPQEGKPEEPEADRPEPVLEAEDVSLSGRGVEASVVSVPPVPPAAAVASVAAMAQAAMPASAQVAQDREPVSGYAEGQGISGDTTREFAFVRAGAVRTAPGEAAAESPSKESDKQAARVNDRRLNIKRESETIENGMHTRIVEVTLSPPEKKEPVKKKGFLFGPNEGQEEDTIPNRPSFDFEGLQFGDNYDPDK